MYIVQYPKGVVTSFEVMVRYVPCAFPDTGFRADAAQTRSYSCPTEPTSLYVNALMEK
jgi:hypothetical protein